MRDNKGQNHLYDEKYKVLSSWRKIPWFIMCTIILMIILQSIEICSCYPCEDEFMRITLCNDSKENWITLGIGIVTLAVTVWLGLNIYSVVTNKEIAELEDKISSVDEKISNLKKISELQFKKNVLDLSNEIAILGKDYPFFSFFEKKIKKMIDSLDPTEDMISVIGDLLIYINELNGITNKYEGNRWYETYQMADELCEKINDKELLRRLKNITEDKIDFLVFEMLYKSIRADSVFYKYAGLLRCDEGLLFDAKTLELRQAIDIYKRIADGLEKMQDEDFDDEMRANLYNTIGYSYELCIKLKELRLGETCGADKINYLNYLAKEYYDKVLDITDKSDSISLKKLARYYHNISICYKRTGDYDGSVNMLNKAIENDPLDYKAWCMLGELIKDENYTDKGIDALIESERCFKRAIEISPTFIEAYRNLDKLYEKLIKYSGFPDDKVNEYKEKKEYIDAVINPKWKDET